MANLAIKGHATRGKEVIELLEMMGGKNVANYGGSNTKIVYFLNGIVICSSYGIGKLLDIDSYTLEEFIEKFPYKVGDKAFAFGNKCTIIDAVWDGGIDEVVYTIKLDTSKYTTTKLSNQLQPCKEETMDKASKAVFDANAQCCDIMNHLIKEETMEEKGDKAKAPNLIGEDYYGKRFGYKIPNGYEFDCIKNNEIILKPKQPHYPKTYEECCEV